MATDDRAGSGRRRGSSPVPRTGADLGRRRRISRRRFLAGAAAAPAGLWLSKAVPAAAATGRSYGPDSACDLPHDVLVRIWRGWRADRSGRIVLVPHGLDYLAGGGLVTHSTPWGYTQHVPMCWYGPGIKPVGIVNRPVTSADIAPTMARLLGFSDFRAPDGRDMAEVALRGGASKPKLIVVAVWDGGGRNVLDLWPDDWPNLRGLVTRGAWYEHATVGSNPSNTAPVHATIGTGAFPRTHGCVDILIRFPDGRIGDPYSRGPDQAILVPALAERYLAAVGEDAVVAEFGTVPWHVGMVGRGSTTGPQPVAVCKKLGANETTAPTWGLPRVIAKHYRFPEYVNDLPRLDDPRAPYFRYADRIDGTIDGKWRGHVIRNQLGGFHTPARIPFQERAVEEVIRREELGTHRETDLLFLNFKLIDEVGHLYYADSPEMSDSVRAQDRCLARFVAFLNNNLGSEWVLLVTSDHGHTTRPKVGGSYPLDQARLRSLVASRFDRDEDGVPLIRRIRPPWMDIDMEELRENHVMVSDLTRFISRLSRADIGRPGGAP